jgi:hypothetical protein
MAASLISPRELDPAHPSPILVEREMRILMQTSFFPTPRADEPAGGTAP